MTIRIQSSADVGTNGIKMMVYGPWGVGKTPLLATAPEVIVISAEQGCLSIKRCNPPVPIVEITNYVGLMEVYSWLATSREAQQFFTIGLDSLSEIIEVLLIEQRKLEKDPRKAFWTVADRGIEFTRAVRDLPGRNVVLIAKEEFAKDANGAQLFMPMMPGNKLGQQLPYFFDEVLRMMIWPNSQQRVLCTQNSYSHQARDRSGMLAEYEPPNLTAVFKKILGYK